MLNLLPNPSFENGWTDLLPYGPLTNQLPMGFGLHIRLPGEPLVSKDAGIADDPPHYWTVTVVPECVHKLRAQMADADKRIRDGDAVYKIFAASGAFSVDLPTQVRIPADGSLEIAVPVEVHQQGDGSPGAAVWRLIVNGVQHPWRTFGAGFEDRTWAVAKHVVGVKAGQLVVATLQVESRALAGIDFFTDAWAFEFEAEHESLEPHRGAPRVQYERTYNVIPQDATDERAAEIFLAGWRKSRETAGGSYDDAGIGDLDRRTAVLWDLADEDQDVLTDWYAADYPGVDVQFDGDEPTPSPPPNWTPKRYIERGTPLGWHAIGNCGLPEMYGGAKLIAPSIKLVAAVSDIGLMPAQYRVVRLIDGPGGVRYEGFDYQGDPEAQAEARIAALVQRFQELGIAGQFEFAEYVNEQDIPDGVSDFPYAANIARFAMRAMEVAPDWLHLAHFSFGPGNPPDMKYWAPIAETCVFERIASRGDAIALHSYHDHRVPSDIEWLLLRHRYLYEQYILPQQLNIPLFLTECGPWVHLLDDDSFDLMAWVRDTDAQLVDDPYVAGAHLYTLDDTGSWEEYDAAFRAIYEAFVIWAKVMEGRING